MSISAIWHRVPSGTKVGAIAAILGFIVTVYSHSETVSNGVVTSCSYTDYGALALGVITAIAAGAGFIENPRRHEKLRLPSQAIVPVSVVLLALAVLHVFRGVGTVGGKC